MARMTPQEEARYSLDFGVSRNDLSPDVQAAYDELLAYRAEHPSSPLPVVPSVITDVYIKRTGWGLFATVVLFTCFCFFLAGPASAAGGGTFWLVLVILWLPGVAFALVLHRARLTTTGDVLTYQVLSQTRAWHREEIAAFGLERNWWSRHTAHLIMDTVAGGQVAFWAIDASQLAEEDELDGWVAALQDWLVAADDPRD